MISLFGMYVSLTNILSRGSFGAVAKQRYLYIFVWVFMYFFFSLIINFLFDRNHFHLSGLIQKIYYLGTIQHKHITKELFDHP